MGEGVLHARLAGAHRHGHGGVPRWLVVRTACACQKTHPATHPASPCTPYSGGAIDGITRQPLWEGGLEYLHGTGHGVGHFLNVHEGPQSVSFRPNAYKGGLQLGMTITDEPGYYEEGAFGIRCVG